MKVKISIVFFVLVLFFVLSAIQSTASGADVTLAWDPPNTETDLAGYKLYWGTSTGSYTNSIDVGNKIRHTISGFTPGVTYYFAATAYDIDGNESDYSEGLVYTVPAANHIITATAGHNGTISPSGAVSINYSANQTFIMNPDVGFEVANILVDGESVGAKLTHTIINVIAEHIISVTFKPIQHTIISSNGPNGIINPFGVQTVNDGGNITFTAIPNSGYGVNKILVDNLPIAGGSSYTFINVITDHTITASFTLIPVVCFEDWDGDGISNQDEIEIYNTDPNDTDTDNDGINDRDELVYWRERWNNDLDYDGIINLLDDDSDNDGVYDGDEILAGTDPEIAKIVFEAGDASATDQWTKVYFSQTYDDPVLVAKPATENNNAPAIVRIRNLTSTDFEIKIQRWDYIADKNHPAEMISWVVFEAGDYRLPNRAIIKARNIDINNTSNFKKVVFIDNFNHAPVVLTSVVTDNENDAVVTRIKNITIAGFELKFQEQESNSKSHDYETVSYIAWEPSEGMLEGYKYKIAKTNNNITHQWRTIYFNIDFSELPMFIADIQTYDGRDTANLRCRNLTESKVDVMVAEEASLNSETYHTTEKVGYLVILKE